MKIYLLNPPFKKGFVRCGRWQGVRARGRTQNYPIWLAYSAALLKEQGKNIQFKDAIAESLTLMDCIRDIDNFKPDIVILDSNFSSFENDALCGQQIKESICNKPKIVLVGPPTSIYGQYILTKFQIDYIARSEYDLTILELANAIERKEDIRCVEGITYRSGNEIIENAKREFMNQDYLDKLPFVSKAYKEFLNTNNYWLDHTINPMVQIMTSRGCPYHCTFCSWPKNFMGNVFRGRSAENVVDELEWITSNLPQVREIFFEDDTFTIDRSRVRRIADLIVERELDITWSCQSRADLSSDLMKSMKSAGCRLLDVGFESGNDEILYNIKKGITPEIARKFAADAHSAGLQLLADMVVGFPGENRITIEDSKRLIHDIRPELLQVAIATPIPGTEFFDWAKKNGYLTEEEPKNTIDSNGFQRCVVSYPALSSQEIEKFSRELLLGYYLSPEYFILILNRLFRKGGLEELYNKIVAATGFVEYYLNREGEE